MNRHFFFNTAALFALITILFTGCTAITGSSDSGSSSKNNDGTYAVTFNVYDAVLAAQEAAGRSILPDVNSDEMYFTVVATNNAGTWNGSTQNDDGDSDSITDVVYWQWVVSDVVTAGVPTDDITLNLKAGEYWRITAYGTAAAGTELDADATLADKKAAITTLTTNAIVTGNNVCFYLGADGTLYKINGNLVAATPAGDEQTDLIVQTAPAANGTGSISLPVKPATGTGITYIKVTYDNRDTSATDPEPTVVSSDITLDSVYEITATDFAPGLYDVTVLFATGSAITDVVYSWPETLTVWGNTESTWVNTVAGNYDGTGADADPYYLDVSVDDVTKYKQITKYVSATSNTGKDNHLPAGSDTTGNGSIFAPYATVEKAVESCAVGSTEWQILVDGTVTNNSLESISGSQLGGVYVSSGTTDDLIITVRQFAANNAEITNSSSLSANPVFYVTGANTTFTLQNITVTGLVTVATDGFIMDNATITGAVSLAAVGNYITIAVADTTSSVGSLSPAYYIYSPVVLHAKDNTDGTKPLTAAWLTTMSESNGFKLIDTYTTAHTFATLAVDQESGSTSLGDVILKRATTVSIDSQVGNNYSVSMALATTSWDHATTWDDKITDVLTITIMDTSPDPDTAVTDDGNQISELVGTLYTSAGIATTGSGLSVDSTTSMTPTFTLPGYIIGSDSGTTYMLEVTYKFNGNLYGGNITLTIN